MSLQDYAEQQTMLGAKIVMRDGCFWRRVRPFFYRPLLPVEPFKRLNSAPVHPWPKCSQYVLPEGQPANSTMNFLMLDDLSTYTLNSVERKRRHLLRRAAQHFQFRPITDPQELKNCGHRVYLSFYERTQYDYRSDRRDKTVFDRWVDSLFFNPKTIICGGFGPNGLSAIATGYWVNETLIHSTLMCDTESLRMNLVDFMFHEIRLMVAQEPRIRQIFVRTYQGGNSLDQYYLHRGCRLVKMPARLEMPKTAQRLLKHLLPGQFGRLCGNE